MHRSSDTSGLKAALLLTHWFRCCLGLITFLGIAWSVPAHSGQREVRVGVYSNEPKIFLDKNGHVAGILGDLLTEIAKREDWTLKPVQCDWQACLDALKAGQIDLLPDLAYSEQRAKEFDFHKIPVLYSWSTIYRREGTPVNTTLELKGKRVAVLDGSIQEGYLRELLAGFGVRAQLIPVKSLEEGFEKVAAKEADAAVANRFFGDLNASRYKLASSPIMFQPTQLFFGTSRGKNSDLLNTIDRHLQDWFAHQDSPYFKTMEKWTGQPAATVVPPWLIKSLGALAVLLLAALLISAYLRRQVIEKTRHLQEGKEALEKSEEKLRIAATAFESQESLMITDADGVILRINRAFTECTGYTTEDVVGQTSRLLKSSLHNEDFYREMWETIHRTGVWQGEVWDRRKNGEIYPKWLSHLSRQNG